MTLLVGASIARRLISVASTKSIDIVDSLSSSEVAHCSRADHSACLLVMVGVLASVDHEFGH